MKQTSHVLYIISAVIEILSAISYIVLGMVLSAVFAVGGAMASGAGAGKENSQIYDAYGTLYSTLGVFLFVIFFIAGAACIVTAVLCFKGAKKTNGKDSIGDSKGIPIAVIIIGALSLTGAISSANFITTIFSLLIGAIPVVAGILHLCAINEENGKGNANHTHTEYTASAKPSQRHDDDDDIIL